MINPKTIKVLLALLVLIGSLFLIFIYVKSKSLQETTCRKTIEYSFAVFLEENNPAAKSSMSNDWSQVDPETRIQLLQRAKETKYSECVEFPYLIEGRDSDGSELPIFARKPADDNLMVKLGVVP